MDRFTVEWVNMSLSYIWEAHFVYGVLRVLSNQHGIHMHTRIYLKHVYMYMYIYMYIHLYIYI